MLELLEIQQIFFKFNNYQYVSYECHKNINVQYLCLTRTNHLIGVFESHSVSLLDHIFTLLNLTIFV